MSSAYLLVSHGSRDPRPQLAVDRLARQLSLRLQQVFAAELPVLVATAQLELAPTPLHQQISDFADRCIQAGIAKIEILPLFLSAGVHAIDDIPAEVAIATANLERNSSQPIEFTVLPFLGAAADFGDLFVPNRFDRSGSTIILAHGSRKVGGNSIVEQLAAKTGSELAYWSIAPSLSDRVAELVAAGTTEMDILPYFLFAGGITDAIAELVAKLQQQLPPIELRLGEPLGGSPQLVETIARSLVASGTNS